jgi:hypothetical protein
MAAAQQYGIGMHGGSGGALALLFSRLGGARMAARTRRTAALALRSRLISALRIFIALSLLAHEHAVAA